VPNLDMVEACRAHHLLVVAAGDNVIRLLPPLIVSTAEIDEAIDLVGAACADLRAEAKIDAAKAMS
ncbi:MAG: hypothetical protein K8F25_09870, partial [Fimbriimonadaceae bacterium]|nr:hypothetical protein [Alphaproteobacteria bacterium]